ncbi:hypothetical protein ASPFODRAFT_576405 [Aspergillus luchuensis CBS 106.47]|uniref:Uncharacterized protein n=1 Tax=Aspergillus luchuensis (strain CBS 106.47) TaxID=1137211 RepID=A0A1M3TLA3_ASPLC|nr:hypothetical protein ASPFODRAFT_576405 [Aspergillus luchuensis CBS 106.47]
MCRDSGILFTNIWKMYGVVWCLYMGSESGRTGRAEKGGTGSRRRVCLVRVLATLKGFYGFTLHIVLCGSILFLLTSKSRQKKQLRNDSKSKNEDKTRPET